MTTDRRTAILDAAERLFAESGFDATSTARVAAEAGAPKGLVFYYFPRKIDLLLALLDERLPAHDPAEAATVAELGDPAGSLVRLDRLLGLGEHSSLTLRTIVFRESGTHPEVARRLLALRSGLVALTEAVLDLTVGVVLDPELRSQAAHTFVAVMLDRASTGRAGGPAPDAAGPARLVSLAVQAAH
ncbi:TetR/AcrR family transcriptional regulator [Ornithinimicrobium avium]|uniref:TetR/AcrR family transcriptional regulator n=1 Tax=Ornithinimicrobium avium TaxID=2283195 RepID=A0A345NPL8_9MICO|nr:TetR/AcrR family transcriptional regulator [Ornithinimicrobium avium]AXH96976.1 TetR/AcrR family transcriptional regulator [Ornithinimicrobium avium]